MYTGFSILKPLEPTSRLQEKTAHRATYKRSARYLTAPEAAASPAAIITEVKTRQPGKGVAIPGARPGRTPSPGASWTFLLVVRISLLFCFTRPPQTGFCCPAVYPDWSQTHSSFLPASFSREPGRQVYVTVPG